MKKIIILIILVWIPVFTGMTKGQGSENITFRALNSQGQPVTGQSGNIQVKDLSGNIITCTVTETGSQGNYIISFPSGTSWTLGKVYLNGVFQQFIGVHWIGDPETVFPTLSANNAFTGFNTFGSTNFIGNINMNNAGYISNLVDPVNAQDAATKSWVTNNFVSSTNSGGNYIRKDIDQTYSHSLTFDLHPPLMIQYYPNEGTGWYRFTGSSIDTEMATPKGYVDSLVFKYPTAQHLYNNNNIFNNNQFALYNSQINLTNPYSVDSNSMRKLSIYKDTIISQTTQQRNWVIKRENFSQEDSQTIKAYYYNSLVSSNPLDSFYLLNKAYNMIDQFKNTILSSTNSSIASFSFPNNSAALWKVTITFEYLFDFGTNTGSDCMDSITVSWAGESTIIKYGYPNKVYTGMQGSATLQVLCCTKGMLPDMNIYGICSQNANGMSGVINRYIKHLRVIAEIIN